MYNIFDMIYKVVDALAKAYHNLVFILTWEYTVTISGTSYTLSTFSILGGGILAILLGFIVIKALVPVA